MGPSQLPSSMRKTASAKTPRKVSIRVFGLPLIAICAVQISWSEPAAAQKKTTGYQSASASSKSSAARRDGDSFVYSDGTRVRATDPSGRDGTAGNDGTIRYADGTSYSYDGSSGVGTIRHADGSVSYAGPNAPRRDGDSYVYGDGMRVRATDHNGRSGEVQKDGSILYSDGTRVSHDSRSGDTKIIHADGRVEVVTPNTPARDGDVFVFGDGYRVRATDEEGRSGTVGTNGTISYPDGTRVSHDVASGDTKVVHADGRVDVHSGNAPTRSGGEYVWRDGTRSVAFDRQGREGKIGPDGVVSFPDGSRISHDNATGVSKIVRADGTVEVTGGDAGSAGGSASGGAGVGVPAELGRRNSSSGGASSAALGQILGNRAGNNTSDGAGTMRGSNAGSAGTNSAGSTRRSNHGTDNKAQQNSAASRQNESRTNNRDTSNRSSNTQNERNANSNSTSDRNTNSNADRGSSGAAADNKDTKASNSNQGRMVLGWGDNNGGGPSIARTIDFAGQPGNDGAAGGGGARSGAQLNRRWSTGPGASGRGLGSQAQGAPIFDSKGLVVNPSPYEQTPDGERREIDPFGGTR